MRITEITDLCTIYKRHITADAVDCMVALIESAGTPVSQHTRDMLLEAHMMCIVTEVLAPLLSLEDQAVILSTGSSSFCQNAMELKLRMCMSTLVGDLVQAFRLVGVLPVKETTLYQALTAQKQT